VDFKTALQELLAPQGRQPEYRLVAESGPAHARVFCSEVIVDGEMRGRGTGTTIKMSEQAAAEEALASLSTASGED
jgi:ribonuclease-3